MNYSRRMLPSSRSRSIFKKHFFCYLVELVLVADLGDGMYVVEMRLMIVPF